MSDVLSVDVLMKEARDILEATVFENEGAEPNDETIAAMNEYYEMKAHPERYNRYSSFRVAMNKVLEGA